MELTKTNDVRSLSKGYKQTEVGLIPEDWRLYLVNDLIELLTDYDANGSFSSVAENVKVYDYEQFAWYVRSTDLENNSKMSEVRYVDKESYTFLKKTALFGGELLFLKRGDIGNVYLFEMKTKYATVAPNLYLLKLNGISNSKYLFYYFTSNQGQLQLKKKNASSTLGALYKDDVKSIYVPLPPTLTEQKAIASALSDVDSLISSLDKLITKKKAIKQGAMQELLTPPHKGGRRLPGFSGDWEEKLFSEVADIRDGTHDSPTYLDNGIKFITSKNIVNNKLSFSNVSFISENDAIEINKRSKVDKGDILMSMIGTIGSAVLIEIEPDFCIKNIALFKPYKNKINTLFLFQKLTSPKYQQYILGKLDGGIQKFISLGMLRNLKITTPTDLEEQKTIAQILYAMDTEIEILEEKKSKYQSIKQGMMQELLTGKTRLV